SATLKNHNLVKRSDDKENILPEALTLISSQSLINKAIYEERIADSDTENNTEDSSDNDSKDQNNSGSEADEDLYQLALNELKWFYNNLESLCEKNDPALDKGICKFISAYKKCCLVQDTYVQLAVASFLQTCDWNAERVNSNSYRRGGKRIKVQVASTAR
ncbi:40769_t:CDS:1, partial [Gigaspora margarita]